MALPTAMREMLTAVACSRGAGAVCRPGCSGQARRGAATGAGAGAGAAERPGLLCGFAGSLTADASWAAQIQQGFASAGPAGAARPAPPPPPPPPPPPRPARPRAPTPKQCRRVQL